MLQLNNINTYYGESHILHGVTLNVKEGEVAVLLGRNGMGKTTTIHSIIGFTPPKKGEVIYKGNPIQHKQNYQIAKLGIGLIPQGKRIFSNLTVKENLTTTAVDYKNGKWSLKKIYDLFPRLKERETSMGGNLSGGEQQMLSFGRALMTEPDILLLDEPTEGLSPLMVKEIATIIKQLKDMNMSMLLVEQNLAMALSVADEVYILNKGEVVFEGTPQELNENEEIKNRHLALSS